MTAGLKKIQVSADYVNGQKKIAVSNARLVQLKARLTGKLVPRVTLTGNTVVKEGRIPSITGTPPTPDSKREKKGKLLGALGGLKNLSPLRAGSPGPARERLFILLSDCLLVCEEREDSKTHKISYPLTNVELRPFQAKAVSLFAHHQG